MLLTTNQLNQVMASGGNLILDGASVNINQLKALASTAAKTNALITVKNMQILSHEHIKQVASLAPGRIFFDFTRS